MSCTAPIRWSTAAIGLIMAGVLSFACRAEQLTATAAAPDNAIDELVVTGERAGPGLWHVHSAAATAGEAWIMGTVSPLPKNITWRSRQLEQILSGTRVVLVGKPFEIGILRALWLFITQRDLLMVPGGRRLKDVMPPELYTRFETLRAQYNSDPDKWTHFRPIIATALLEQAALRQVGLSARLDIGNEVRTLAHKHDVRIEEIKIAGVRDFLDVLKSMPPAVENTCAVAALATIESGLPRLVARAQAWVTGDLERIQSLPESAEVDACIAALSGDLGARDLLAQIRRTWAESLDEQLRAGGVTVAVVNMDLLLERGGLLAALQARGYTVDPP
ncbi:MAG TPA: TraB/GumN family protein [Steroidobacteraceae bacterium]|nr:TraB/GumN family protein [Steroidobacteraceae bacterium]